MYGSIFMNSHNNPEPARFHGQLYSKFLDIFEGANAWPMPMICLN